MSKYSLIKKNIWSLLYFYLELCFYTGTARVLAVDYTPLDNKISCAEFPEMSCCHIPHCCICLYDFLLAVVRAACRQSGCRGYCHVTGRSRCRCSQDCYCSYLQQATETAAGYRLYGLKSNLQKMERVVVVRVGVILELERDQSQAVMRPSQ